MLNLICALAENNAIGFENRLLYRLSSDLRHFKELTSGHTVIMGRKTFDSLPKGALPNRRNIVLTRQQGLEIPGVEIFNSLPAEDSKPVLIHADLNIMNIMADPKTLKLIAFIDPNGCMWAHREYDLYQFHNMWGDSYGLYETYKEKCPLSPYADFRVAYYGAMHEVSMRLKVGHVIPLWEDLNIRRLKKEMKKLKDKI